MCFCMYLCVYVWLVYSVTAPPVQAKTLALTLRHTTRCCRHHTKCKHTSNIYAYIVLKKNCYVIVMLLC